VNDTNLEVILNGVLVASLTDLDKQEGHIALQRAQAGIVSFRNFKLFPQET
jgi:ABC-type polar amino acid transport system ATPase subunit